MILIKIITSFLMFIELTISMLLFTTILNINTSKHQRILYILILSFMGIITLWFIPIPFNTFINILACPLLVYFIFKTSILKAILSNILPYVFFIISGILVKNIFLLIPNITNEALLNIPLYRLLYYIVNYSLLFLLYLLLKKINLHINLKDTFKRKTLKILLLNLTIGIFAIAVKSYLVTFYGHELPLHINMIDLSVLILYFFISMYSLSRTNKLELTSERLEEEQLYNKTLTILYDNIRGFKHDFNNIVQSIGGYISTNNMEGLKDYYSGLIDDCQKVNNLAVLNPELINNPAVYSLLTSKYHKSEELGIKMNFEIFLDLETLNIKTYDLTRILGILLDNAIEASSKCDEKEVNIIIRKDTKANRQLFVIENTYSNKDVNTDRIFEKGYTSKTEDDGKNHGLGLWEVRQILKKNNNLNLYTTKDNKLFKQQLEIYF